MYRYGLIKTSSGSSTLDIQATRSSETPVNIFQNTRRRDPQHSHYLRSPLHETSELADLLELISINVLSPILCHWLLGICLDTPVQCLPQYTQEGVTPSYAILHTSLKLPSLAVLYTRADDNFICLSESHCAPTRDGPEALLYM